MTLKSLRTTADRPLAFLERLCVLIGCVLLWGIFALVILQVVTRTFLGMGLPWPHELARYLHIILVFLGIAFAHRMRSHVNVSYFSELLSPRARRVLAGAIEALIVAVSVVIVVGCVMLITGPMGAQRSPSLGLPVMYFVAGTAVGFTLMALESLRQLVRLMSGEPALAEADRPEPSA